MMRLSALLACTILISIPLLPGSSHAQTCMRTPVLEVVGGHHGHLTPDARRFIHHTAAYPSQTRVVDLEAGSISHVDGAEISQVTPDGRTTFLYFNGGSTRAFESATLKPLSLWSAGEWPRIEANRFVSVSHSKLEFVRLVDLTNGRVAWEFRDGIPWRFSLDSGETTAIAYEPGGEGRSGQRSIHLVDLGAARTLATLREDFAPTNASISADRKYFAAADRRAKRAALRRLLDGALVGRYEGYARAQFLSNGKLLLTPDTAPGYVLIEPDGARQVATLPKGGWTGGEFIKEFPNRRLLLLGEGGFVIADSDSLRPLQTFSAEVDAFHINAISRVTPSGEKALLGKGNSWQIKDTASGHTHCTFVGLYGEPVSMSDHHVAFRLELPKTPSDPIPKYRFTILPLEAEGAAQAKSQSERDGALATSAGLSPQDRVRAQGLFKQAFDLFQAGEFEAAIIGFQRGLAIDPASGLGHYYLAETYARQGKTTEARQHYRKTLDFAPDSKEALLAQTRVDKM